LVEGLNAGEGKRRDRRECRDRTIAAELQGNRRRPRRRHRRRPIPSAR
jgi:hypothetical protein